MSFRSSTAVLRRAVALATVLSASLIPPLSVQAATPTSASATFQVGATILVACNVTGSTLTFGGAIDPLQTPGPVDASTSLNVTCTKTTPYSVALSAGTNAGNASAFGSRTMKSGNNNLPYQLYLDSGRTQVWGDGNGAGVYTGTGTGSQQVLTVYGRLPSLAGIVPGNYSDTVTVTITY
ncbi:MAG: spore coat protein U domain-containing protein [Mitsuaria chitosanitabida]|uniref:Csu type fimbrial protein n=1 Tax=Roseateles chitosanitabidus TaxID=65048 RepID=UPI001B0EB196|nr:spore coat U domain-containing protein [Roseateles chitosanitabidus]MBO9688762.1 spore coat protein U domain-containing protein [Roseateles chitosanitabidus]